MGNLFGMGQSQLTVIMVLVLIAAVGAIWILRKRYLGVDPSAVDAAGRWVL